MYLNMQFNSTKNKLKQLTIDNGAHQVGESRISKVYDIRKVTNLAKYINTIVLVDDEPQNFDTEELTTRVFRFEGINDRIIASSKLVGYTRTDPVNTDITLPSALTLWNIDLTYRWTKIEDSIYDLYVSYYSYGHLVQRIYSEYGYSDVSTYFNSLMTLKLCIVNFNNYTHIQSQGN